MKHFARQRLKDPLIQFILLGVLVFGVNNVNNQTPPHIIISAEHQRNIAAQSYDAYVEAPNQKTINRLIQQEIENEVLYQEGLRYGLEIEDPVIRKRIIQKMNFMLEGMAAAPPPDRFDLETYVQLHSDRYQQQPRYSFQHIFFKNKHQYDQHNRHKQRATKTLATLTNQPLNPQTFGDPFIKGNQFSNITLKQVSHQFGEPFAKALSQLKTGHWIGPTQSSYGSHLVFLSSKTQKTIPRLEAIRDIVYSDWQKEKTQQKKRHLINDLVSTYHVEIEETSSTQTVQPIASR